MNIYIIQNPENDNFLTEKWKWSAHPYKARLFKCLSNAKTVRAQVKDKAPIKLIIQEYELIHRSNK